MTIPITPEQAFCKLAVIVADGLTGLKSTNFHSDSPILALITPTAAAFVAWRDALDLRDLETMTDSGDGGLIYGAYGDWHGWRVQLSAHCPAGERQPAEVVDDLTHVRQVAEGGGVR